MPQKELKQKTPIRQRSHIPVQMVTPRIPSRRLFITKSPINELNESSSDIPLSNNTRLGKIAKKWFYSTRYKEKTVEKISPIIRQLENIEKAKTTIKRKGQTPDKRNLWDEICPVKTPKLNLSTVIYASPSASNSTPERSNLPKITNNEISMIEGPLDGSAEVIDSSNTGVQLNPINRKDKTPPLGSLGGVGCDPNAEEI